MLDFMWFLSISCSVSFSRATAVQDRGLRGPRSAVTRRRRGPRSRTRWEAAVRGPRSPAARQPGTTQPPSCPATQPSSQSGSQQASQPPESQPRHCMTSCAVRGPRSPAEGAVRGPGFLRLARSAVREFQDFRGPRPAVTRRRVGRPRLLLKLH